MARKKRGAGVPPETKRMEAHVSNFRNGLRVYRNVWAVRIQSRDYTLLIMEDYLPTIGEVDGRVCILTEEDEYRLEGVRGFFCQRENLFELLIEEDSHVV